MKREKEERRNEKENEVGKERHDEGKGGRMRKREGMRQVGKRGAT